MVDPELERLAAEKLQGLLAEDGGMEEEVRRLRTLGRAVVFGGWVRDAVHTFVHGDDHLPSRDFDIVVDGPLPATDTTGTTGRVEMNHFGGQRVVRQNGLRMDCWQLSGTLAFTRGLLAPSFANLLHSTVYRLNGCLIDLESFRLAGEAAIEDIRARRISFSCIGYLDVYPEFQAFRGLDLADRLGYALDGEVRDFVLSTLRGTTPDRFSRGVREHRPGESQERIERLFRAGLTD